MMNHFLWTTPESKILLHKALSLGLTLAQERFTLTGNETSENEVALLKEALALLTPPKRTRLSCPTCRIDRFESPCPRKGIECGLSGVAQSSCPNEALNPFSVGQSVICVALCDLPRDTPYTVRLTRPGYIGLEEIAGRYPVNFFRSVTDVEVENSPVSLKEPNLPYLSSPSLAGAEHWRKLFEESYGLELLTKNDHGEYQNREIQYDWLAYQIATLTRCLQNLHTTAIAAAEEIQEHWDAHCDEEGYGPSNLMTRLERGISVGYPTYSFGQFTLTQRKIERLESALVQLTTLCEIGTRDVLQSTDVPLDLDALKAWTAQLMQCVETSKTVITGE